MRRPSVTLQADNKPLADALMSRLINLTITDNSTGEADELSLSLSDADGLLELPRRGVQLSCQMGYRELGLVDMGVFTVDTVEWAGTPDVLTIKAKSADFKGSLKNTRSQSYHETTFGEIARTVATRHGLGLSMPDELYNIGLQHIDQTDESDLHLLTRLGVSLGASLAIKSGQLVIFKAGTHKSVSGRPLDLHTVTRQMGNAYRFSIEDRTDTDSVEASYYNKETARRHVVNENGVEVTERTGNARRIRGVYADKDRATRAAAAALERTKMAQATFSINLSYAYPAISTESPVMLSGFKPELDALTWTVKKVTHSYSKSGGLVTALELVAPFNAG